MTSFLDRLLGRPEPPTRRYEKAVRDLGGAWTNSYSLSMMANSPQERCAAYLRAYKVGWFYKAGKKIADDISSLDWSVSEGDVEEGADETTLDRPKLAIPFDSLTPIEQFMRLLERPNPSYTGRQLFRKTQVRLDFAGAAFWYLENGTGLLPTAIYGISPTRMWPSYDSNGTLIGWVMDKDSPNPVPFDVREILPFATGNADSDEVWGVSVVEAVYAQVPLTNLMAQHTAGVLTTGGRMAGMLWPKERALDEAEFADAQRAWRNATSTGDAAKRLLIFPEPMEYASGASTPAEIGIPDLAVLNRDEILTAFPVSPYQLGVPTPGGLNSGEVRREDRRDYWEGTIHPRADLIEEAIQVGLLSRYEAVMGQTFDFELAEPNLDDAASLTLKAEAFKSLVSIGLDPKESLKAAALSHIKFLGLPAILDPVQQQMMQQQAQEAQLAALNGQQDAPKPSAKPAMPTKVARAIQEREQRTDAIAATVKRDLEQFFRDQRDRVKAGVEKLPASKAARIAAVKADPLWWDSKREDDELKAVMRNLYVQVGRAGLQVAADELNRIIQKRSVDPIVTDLLSLGGKSIKAINDRTLQALTIELAEGTRRGYSIPQLIEGVPDEGYKGVLGVTLENGTPVFGDLRAETIARTETRASYNRASVLGYKELGVEEFLAYDGDDDEACAQRNGNIYSAEDALAEEEDEHPNGTLTFSPVVDKAYHESAPVPVINLTVQNHMAPGQAPDVKVYNDIATPAVTISPPDVTVNVPEQAAPVVNVAAAEVNVPATVVNVPEQPAPVVNIAPPEVNVTATVAAKTLTMPQDLRIVSMPDRLTERRVKRDKQGHIVETTDVETDA